MLPKFRGYALTLLLLPLLLIQSAWAAPDTERTVGNYQLYYNAFSSTFIQPDIARAVGIARDPELGVLSLAIHDLKGQAVRVGLKGYTQDLMQRKQPLEFQLVEEGPAIYYLANFAYSDQETLHFIVDITPPGERSFTLKFNRTLYRD